MERKETTMRQLLESDDYGVAKAIIQAEVNENKLVIDRSVFTKDQEEYEKTETAKYHWRVKIQKEGFTKRNYPMKIIFKS